MSFENLLLLLVFLVLPLLERLSQWMRERARERDRTGTPPSPADARADGAGRRPAERAPEARLPAPERSQVPERARPAEAPRPGPAPVPEPVRRQARTRRSSEEQSMEDVSPERHEPVWNDAAWRYPTSDAPGTPVPTPPPPSPAPAPRPRPDGPAPGPVRRPMPPSLPRRPGDVSGRVPRQAPVPAELPPPVPRELWRQGEALRQQTITVESGDLTAAPAGPAQPRGPRPAHQLRLTDRAELRRAIVLMTVLGPPKAEERGSGLL